MAAVSSYLGKVCYRRALLQTCPFMPILVVVKLCIEPHHSTCLIGHQDMRKRNPSSRPITLPPLRTWTNVLTPRFSSPLWWQRPHTTAGFLGMHRHRHAHRRCLLTIISAGFADNFVIGFMLAERIPALGHGPCIGNPLRISRKSSRARSVTRHVISDSTQPQCIVSIDSCLSPCPVPCEPLFVPDLSVPYMASHWIDIDHLHSVLIWSPALCWRTIAGRYHSSSIK
jgi:hypothetical protein